MQTDLGPAFGEQRLGRSKYGEAIPEESYIDLTMPHAAIENGNARRVEMLSTPSGPEIHSGNTEHNSNAVIRIPLAGERETEMLSSSVPHSMAMSKGTDNITTFLKKETHVKTMPTSGISGMMEKKILSSVVFWEARQCCLTDKALCFALVGDTVVCDEILLHEIVNVFIDGDAKATGNNKKSAGTSEDKKTLVIRTDINGHNAGRTYIHRSKNPEDLTMWCREISHTMKKAKVDHSFQMQIDGKSAIYKYYHSARCATRTVFDGFWFQLLIGFVIICSFAVDVGEAEVLPERNTQMAVIFRSLDLLFTAIFFFGTLWKSVLSLR